MQILLSPIEARVVGALIEKEITTPDQYPLSLNALTNACNQKTNRDPVLELDERTVQDALDALSRRHLVMERSGFGSRVVKYRHRLCNGEHNPLQFSPQELAVVCELLLRGPQTPGELRSRAQRLAPFTGLGDVEQALERLASRSDGPFVARLPRQPGAREARYAQLFTGAPPAVAEPAATDAPEPPPAGGLAERVAALEAAVAALSEEVERLKAARGPSAGA
ncbi:MAG: YceH family protein [Proteobacteria bacterium]|nr:YceH family protein [Pseudomonadota bacterium]